MAWQQPNDPYSQQGPPPPGFYPGSQPYPGQAPYPGQGYPGQAPYPGQGYPGQAPYPGQGYPGQAPYPGQQYPGQAPNSGQASYPGGQNPNMPNYSYGTPEGGNAANMNFSEKTIRAAFIRKVYLILSAQLAVTAFFIVLLIKNQSTKLYVAQHSYLLWVALGVSIVTLLVLSCCESVARSTPTNYIFLFIFTIAEGFLLGVTSARYGEDQVLLAVGITALICFSLTLFAFQTKVDFTAMGGVLMVLLIILLVASIILIFVPSVKPVRIGIACAGAFIFSLFLIYDTQLMLGGNHKYAMSPEDYVFAALAIYLDIINIFLYILQIINELSKD